MFQIGPVPDPEFCQKYGELRLDSGGGPQGAGKSSEFRTLDIGLKGVAEDILQNLLFQGKAVSVIAFGCGKEIFQCRPVGGKILIGKGLETAWQFRNAIVFGVCQGIVQCQGVRVCFTAEEFIRKCCKIRVICRILSRQAAGKGKDYHQEGGYFIEISQLSAPRVFYHYTMQKNNYDAGIFLF